MSKTTFAQLGLSENILSSLADLGYEAPSPVQAESIPVLIEGKNLVAQAQTGTGKTAAFALPVLQRLTLKALHVQALILTPTRELAIQVAESFKSYGKNMTSLHALAIYGGQNYSTQLKALKRGVQIVVGTPGRIMDHMRRGTLKLDHLSMIVLDEADEMLKMGFIDDVAWILEQIPKAHQIAMFSATMPESIQKISKKYIENPYKVQIQTKTRTVPQIKQYFTLIAGHHKLEALTRVLEVEDVDAAIIFTRTKTMAAEIADKLEARGFAAAAIHGDLNQNLREKTINRLKQGNLDIVVATDVAARGLDVERVSHVINYDIPYNTESYIHRIGRTGRAGREGMALTFIVPRERRALTQIEKDTRQTITESNPITLSQISSKRKQNFFEKIREILASQDLNTERNLIRDLCKKAECSELDIAAALAHIAEGAKKSVSEKDKLEILPKPEREKDFKKFKGKDKRKFNFDRPKKNFQRDKPKFKKKKSK